MLFAMIQTQDLFFRYGDQGQGFDFPDLAIEAGQHHLILGPSGCGKSTLLHLLGGLLRPEKGRIFIKGQDLTLLAETALDRFRGQHIGLVFQQSYLLRSLNVLENLLTAQFLAGLPQVKTQAMDLLKALNIEHRAQAKVAELSLGEQQRVALARALINRPALLLADEPTSSLDDENCNEVLKLLLEQSNHHQTTLVLVTHDARLKAHFPAQISLEKPSPQKSH